MGCDNTPVSRQDIMDAMVQSGKFEGDFRGFTKNDGPLGKKMNNSKTREIRGTGTAVLRLLASPSHASASAAPITHSAAHIPQQRCQLHQNRIASQSQHHR